MAEFARDVPKGQLMTVAAMMDSGGLEDKCPPEAPVLRSSMKLDTALTVCTSAPQRMKVTDDTGQVVGTVTLDNLARAIAHQQDRE